MTVLIRKIRSKIDKSDVMKTITYAIILGKNWASEVRYYYTSTA